MNGRPDDGLFKVSIIVVICAYMLLGQAMIPSGFGWNPQFNLKTFAQKPTETTRYELRFTEINGIELSEPLYFADAGASLSNEDIYEGKKTINRLGISLYKEDGAGIEVYRQELEEIYFGNFESAKYDIVFIDVNPVEKYSLESFKSESIISQFSHPNLDPLASEPPAIPPSTN